MKGNDFLAFSYLFSNCHLTAFGEPMNDFNHQKSQALSWLIFDKTGVMLSYKTLTNYAKAILENDPERINPNLSTLEALLRFEGDNAEKQPAYMSWLKFRANCPLAAAG
jgi:hypothetical protein